MKKDYGACWLPISAITTEVVFIFPWIRIHRIHDPFSPLAKLLRFPKSVACITGTIGVRPDSVLPFEPVPYAKSVRSDRTFAVIRRSSICRTETSVNVDDYMNEKDEDVAHAGMVSNP